MVLDSYYFGLCRFGFRDLCDDWGTNRVICGYGIRICGVECVLDFDSLIAFFFIFLIESIEKRLKWKLFKTLSHRERSKEYKLKRSRRT